MAPLHQLTKLGVLPKLVEKNSMYLCRGLLYTCCGLGFLSLVSISPILSTLRIPEILHNFWSTSCSLPIFHHQYGFLPPFLKSFFTPPLPISHFSGICRGKGGERERYSNNLNPCRSLCWNFHIWKYSRLSAFFAFRCGWKHCEARESHTASILMCLLQARKLTQKMWEMGAGGRGAGSYSEPYVRSAFLRKQSLKVTM